MNNFDIDPVRSHSNSKNVGIKCEDWTHLSNWDHLFLYLYEFGPDCEAIRKQIELFQQFARMEKLQKTKLKKGYGVNCEFFLKILL